MWITILLINTFVGSGKLLIQSHPRVQSIIQSLKQKIQTTKESVMGKATREEKTKEMYEETIQNVDQMQEALVGMFASLMMILVFGVLVCLLFVMS